MGNRASRKMKQIRLGENGVATNITITDGEVEELEQLFRESLREILKKSSKRRAVVETSRKIQTWARLVYDCMSQPGRVYHSVQHVLDVVHDMTPETHAIPILAALFHDVIYLSIDKGLLPTVEKVYLPDVLVEIEKEDDGSEDIRVSWKETSDNNRGRLWQEQRHLVDSVFGGLYASGPEKNLNEYLSALVAVRAIWDSLDTTQITMTAACIEATVPFRPTQPTTPMENLYQRLCDNNKSMMTDAQLIHAVQQAAFCANCDLGSFSTTNPYHFLDNSWKLLPEWAPALLAPQPRLTDMRRALRIMMQCYQHLSIDRLFQSFRSMPTDAVIAEKKRQTRKNVQMIGEYAAARLVGLETVLEALRDDETVISSALGGSTVFWKVFYEKCHAESFLTDASSEDEEPYKATLPKRQTTTTTTTTTGWNELVHDMLVQGRRTQFVWDAAEAPWAAHIYRTLGPAKLEELTTSHPPEASWLACLPASSVNLLADVLQEVLPESNFDDIRRPEEHRTWDCVVS